jgi:hypothetical protein
MREQLTAWSGDCRVTGEVELSDGRLSDQVNELQLLTFHDATLVAIEDGREIAAGDIEVERREIYVVEVQGRRGDPERRLRTIPERVRLDLGPFAVTGYIHRSPAAQPHAAVAGWARFVPVTGAVIEILGRTESPPQQDTVLVNRERIKRTDPLPEITVYESEPWSPLPDARPPEVAMPADLPQVDEAAHLP